MNELDKAIIECEVKRLISKAENLCESLKLVLRQVENFETDPTSV